MAVGKPPGAESGGRIKGIRGMKNHNTDKPPGSSNFDAASIREKLSKDMTAHDIVVPSPIIDGKFHRFGKNKNGYYMIFNDEYPAGVFGEWGRVDPVKWSLKSVKEMTPQESSAYQARIKILKEEHDRQQAIRWTEAAAEAVKEWSAAVDVVDHPYLKSKQVPSIGLRQDKEGRLLIPVYNSDENLQSLQRIGPDDSKRFMTGGKMAGGFYFIDGVANKIAIVEGYATGATIHQATGCTVYVGFNSGNLLPVAKIVKARHPGAEIVVCCDNDQWTKGNPGLTKGQEAAEAIGASVAVPIFKEISTKPTDFNDLMTLEDIAEVKRQIMSATEKAQSNKLPPLTPGDTKIKGRLLSEPPPAEYILSCRGYPFMKKGVVSLLISAGGLGKTFLMLCFAMLLARGGRWGCFEAEKPLKTLVLCAEDDQEEVDRRLWTIGNGVFPENLHVASIVGKIGPLMKLDGENPVRSENYSWLNDTIEAHRPLDVLFLDPLSRLYGLTENRNEHATAFITALESLAVGYGMNIMTSHHANKVSADQPKAKQGMARGASGFIDGCRLALGLTEISDDDATNYGIEGREQYFKLDTLKSNGSAKLQAPVFFKKDQDTGFPECVAMNKDKIANMAAVFFQAFIAHGKPETERALLRGEPTELFSQIRESLPSLSVKKFMKPILSYLTERGLLIEVLKERKDGNSKIYSTVNMGEQTVTTVKPLTDTKTA